MRFNQFLSSRCITSLLTVVLVTVSGQFASAQESVNDGDLLLQDSFEEGAQAPEGWKQGAAIPGVKYIYERAEASDGKRSLCLHKTANRFFPIAAWMRTIDHSGAKPVLQMSAQVKAAGARKAILDVAFLDENGKWIKHEWIEYIGQKEQSDRPATHDWKEYKGTAEIPAGTKQIVLGLQIYGPGKVWFDELDVRYVDSAGDTATEKSTGSVTVDDAKRQATSRTDGPEPISVQLKNNHRGRYLLVAPDSAKSSPAEGLPLLIVLPGGTGSADFHPFVQRISEQALGGDFVVAQPLAPSYVVWPTSATVNSPMSTTEELIAAVIDDVAKKHALNRDRIYLLAWSSGGPAAYAILLQEDSPLAGAMIAMSLFKPDQLPPLSNAHGRSVYLLHSPEDPVCPYFMAEAAKEQMTAAGARVKLVNYEGGHGWHGPVFDQIREGIDWLRAE